MMNGEIMQNSGELFCVRILYIFKKASERDDNGFFNIEKSKR